MVARCRVVRREVPAHTADVPFAYVVIAIACFTQQFGDGRGVLAEAAGVARWALISEHMPDAGLMGIKPCEQ